VRNSRVVYASVILGILLVVAIGAAVIITRTQISDNGSLQERVLSIASQLHAPGDENTITVATSSLSTAQHTRFEIQQDLLAGMNRNEVLDSMQQEYGPGVLAAPSLRGFGSVVWIIPGAVLLGLLMIAGYMFRAKGGTLPNTVASGKVEQGTGAMSQEELVRDDRLQDYL
jgi:cytochrome c-type biogenesis protein CcmH/NrfF